MISQGPQGLPCDGRFNDQANSIHRPSLSPFDHSAPVATGPFIHSILFLICAYLVPSYTLPTSPWFPGDLCLAALSQIPFFSLPSSFAAEKDLRRVACEATWLTRVPNSSQSQYHSPTHAHALSINNLRVRPRQPARPTSAPNYPPCASLAHNSIYAQSGQPVTPNINPTARFQNRIPLVDRLRLSS